MAVHAVREACYALANYIDDKGLLMESDSGMPNYNDALTEQARKCFSGIGGNDETRFLNKKFEHVIHWILFEAGMQIDNMGDYKNSWSVVRRDGFDPELIEAGIKKYGKHIRNLATLI